jgi:flagellar biosynthesis protein FliQ
MDNSLSDVGGQAWRLMFTLIVPTLAIPLVSAIFSFVFGLIGVRDEGIAYALRILALIGVGVLCAPIVTSSLVGLMVQALR